MGSTDLKEMLNTILGDDKDIILEVPLKDLVWTMIVFSNQMAEIEKEAFGDTYPYRPLDMTQEQVDKLIQEREYKACRRDEISGIITRYSDFDTERIYKEVIKLFKPYTSKGIRFD